METQPAEDIVRWSADWQQQPAAHLGEIHLPAGGQPVAYGLSASPLRMAVRA